MNTTAIAYTQNSAFLPGSWHHATCNSGPVHKRQDVTSNENGDMGQKDATDIEEKGSFIATSEE